MVIKNKSIIAKGVFAVAVVAVTATVGIVGFAQAAHRPGSGADNGYGGGTGQLLAAIHQFERSLRTAEQKFHQDVNACLASTHQNMHDRGVTNRRGVDDQFNNAANNFNKQSDDAVNQLSSRVANPSALGHDKNSVNNHIDSAKNDSDQHVSDADTQLANTLATVDNDSNRNNNLRQCLNTAKTHYQQAVDAARDAFLAAIHNIFG